MTIVTRRDRHRVYPTEEQIVLLKKNLGSSRFIYNQCVEYAQYAYENGLKYPGYYGEDGFARLVTRLKDIPEYSWLKDADSTSLQSAAKNAHKAYDRMFAGKADRPRYKSKRDYRQTY